MEQNSKTKVKDVINRFLEGSKLSDALKQEGLSAWMFNKALQSDRELAQVYARAAEIKADLLADEVVAIADSDGDPAKVRNQIQARQWVASKYHGKRYGDKIDLNVTQTIDIGLVLAEAKARLRPVCDQLENVNNQVIEMQGDIEHGDTDKDSFNQDSDGKVLIN